LNDSDQFTDELVARLRQGDPEAAERLNARYSPWIERFARRLGLNPHEAEEVAQDTLADVLKALPAFTPGKRFESWLFTIARRRIADSWRRLAREAAHTGHANLASLVAPESSTSSPERQAALEKALEHADPIDQRIIAGIRNGAELQEIADALGIGYDAVRQRKSRLIRRLRAELNSPDVET